MVGGKRRRGSRAEHKLTPGLPWQQWEPGPCLAPSTNRAPEEQQERAAVAREEAETKEAAQAQPGGNPAWIHMGWTPPAQEGPSGGGEHRADGANAGPRRGDEDEECPGQRRRSRARSHRSHHGGTGKSPSGMRPRCPALLVGRA